MATIAYISEQYREGMTSDTTITMANETVTQTQLAAGHYLAGASHCNAENFVATKVINTTTGGVEILSGNFSLTDTGQISNLTSSYTNFSWDVSYTYTHSGTACNVTEDLDTELSDNTSIAGIVLTISLVGIILSVLIGVFSMARRRTI